MTQQVLYATATGEIIQWQDTTAFNYAAPPAGTATLAVTPAQWAEQTGAYYVSNGALVAGTIAPPAPTLAQQAEALIAGGITITSTGTPALNGVYSCNAQAQANLQAVQIYIQANGKFPGSAGTYPWLDMAGTPHIYPSITEFTALASRIADFVADCTLIILTGEGTLPPNTATIP